MIVQTMTIGNTKISIADDYCVGPEEVTAILERIAARAYRRLAAAAKETGTGKKGGALPLRAAGERAPRRARGSRKNQGGRVWAKATERSAAAL